MSILNSRLPSVLSPPLVEGNPWTVSDEGGAQLDRTVDIASSGLAFKSNGRGGVSINSGSPFDDLYWESNGEGGIQLKLGS